MSILSSVIHSNIIPNLYASLSTAEHKRRHFEECFNCSFLYNESQWGPKQHCLHWLFFFKISVSPFCGRNEKSHRFGTV